MLREGMLNTKQLFPLQRYPSVLLDTDEWITSAKTGDGIAPKRLTTYSPGDFSPKAEDLGF